MNIETLNNVQVEGVDMADYPDFVDAYISYAEDANGNELSDEQLEQLTEENQEFVQELAHEHIMGAV